MEATLDKIPSVTRRIRHKYAAMVAQIEALEPGVALKVKCASYAELKRVRHGVVYDNKERNSGSDVVILHHREDNNIWFWIDKEKT